MTDRTVLCYPSRNANEIFVDYEGMLMGRAHVHNYKNVGKPNEVVVGTDIVRTQKIKCKICGYPSFKTLSTKPSRLRKIFGTRAGKRFDYTEE